MSRLSPGFRLAKLRREGRKKGVFDRSVYPKKRSSLGGIVETELSRQAMDSQGKVAFPSYAISQDALAGTVPARKATNGLQTAFQGIFVGASTRPVLHPRPRAIYGDEYAPVNCAAPVEPILKENKGRKRKHKQATAKKCTSCTSDAGQGCMRLLPNPKSSKMGLDITLLRAMQSRSTRTSQFPPGPSPLSKSFTVDDYADTNSDDSQESDSSSDDSTASAYSTQSQEDLTARREVGMYLLKAGETAYIDDRGVFSPGYSYFDLVAAYPGSDKQIVTCIQKPTSPETNGRGRAAEVNEIWLNEDVPSRTERDNLRATSSHSDDGNSALAGRGIPFPTIPSDDDSGPQSPRPRSASEPLKGWRRLRAIGSGLIKKRSDRGSLYK